MGVEEVGEKEYEMYMWEAWGWWCMERGVGSGHRESEGHGRIFGEWRRYGRGIWGETNGYVESGEGTEGVYGEREGGMDGGIREVGRYGRGIWGETNGYGESGEGTEGVYGERERGYGRGYSGRG